MDYLKIDKTTAKKLYKESPEWLQKQMTEVFGEEFFKKRDFRDIKTYEDACEDLDINPAQFSRFETYDEIAYKKLKVIIRAINQGWKPDWNNTNQKKWWPYFNLSSGFGFSGSSYDYGNSNSHVGSRLCFESEEKSNYTAKQFMDIYKDLLT